ncbi:type I phosphomannose isomerase catalytic subunit [Luteolibacter sp. LG18]|uniref:type I phosphomannose isomerase catalytic subunit n=1 Tax=Luteolibacter sp. LG18 TaxID=2819286 RepID=UPI002B323549|nr:mannose-6-phosphate isomerase [Luteolibacter sp. LG18]
MAPITFTPLYMDRVWGGRELERVYGRTLPDATTPIGEAWEIVDRDPEQSVVNSGPFAGKSLHELWSHHRGEIFGEGLPDSERFPILIKILDSRDDLSIQVHPPVDKADELGGEPKTEMWVIAAADPGARLYVGLKNGVARSDFEAAIADGTVEKAVHAIAPQPGESIFIPSGRLHAIGAGLLIHEIQQNSDTTYRVFDWNRMGLDGKPRALHVEQSLASIDFEDFEPGMDVPNGDVLAECPYFRTSRHELADGALLANPDPGRFTIVGVVEGALVSTDNRRFVKGDYILQPKGASPLVADGNTVALQVELP